MYYYVVNPAASGLNDKNLQSKIRDRLDQLGIRGEWAKTTGPGEAQKLTHAAVANGHTTIIAVGGDDTVNEVINGITNENVAVGIIPVGSKNRLARQLGIINWQQACEALAARRLTSYSLIAAGQKFFLSTLTLGFETDLDKSIDTTSNSIRSLFRQFISSLGKAQSYQTLHCKIDVDNEYQLECDFFNLSISNQKFLNPLADNRLIVSLSDRPSRHLRLSKFVWHTLRNEDQHSFEDVITTRFLAKRVVIETTPPTGIMVDGKVAGRTPIAIRLTDRRVRFITEKIIADFKNAIQTS